MQKLDNFSPDLGMKHLDSNDLLISEEKMESLKFIYNKSKNNAIISQEVNNQKRIFNDITINNNNCKIIKSNRNVEYPKMNDFPQNSFCNFYQPHSNKNLLNEISFNQLAFSPTHFTPSFYQEVLSVCKKPNTAGVYLVESQLKNNFEKLNSKEKCEYVKCGSEEIKMSDDEKKWAASSGSMSSSSSGLTNSVGKKKFCERVGDWVCIICKNLNFKFRVACNRCKCPKENSKMLFERCLQNIAESSKLNERLQNQYNIAYSSYPGYLNSNSNSNNAQIQFQMLYLNQQNRFFNSQK